jgi:O-Glycosyl hydrolase
MKKPNLKSFFLLAALALSSSFWSVSVAQKKVPNVAMYQTTGDHQKVFSAEKVSSASKATASTPIIKLDDTQKFQEMDGFGAAITGSTCYNLLKMSPEDRAVLLKETFDPKDGLGYSYIRVSIGCSDFSVDEYTCCDKEGIENFEMPAYDRRDLFPILHEILAINPDIKILGSPWTCPPWMKIGVNDDKPYNSWTSGRLNPKYYGDYAKYFVLWIQAMEKEGFPISSITIQNEPLNKGNSASLYMTWEEQRDFIKVLGPQLRKAGLETKIWVFDHNYNYDNIPSQQNYATNIYNDPEAAKYIDGSAWHAYGGDCKELDEVHAKAPDKGIYFTEMSIGTWNYSWEGDLMWNFREVCLGTINRWCKAVIMWNLMLDADRGPNRPKGCRTCFGAIDINKDFKTMTKNTHYFTMGHLSKVIKPGAIRIGSSMNVSDQDILFSAFVNPDGSYAMVLQNDSKTDASVVVNDGTNPFVVDLPKKSVTSLRWNK